MTTKLPAGAKRFYAMAAAPNPDGGMAGVGMFDDERLAVEAIEKYISQHKGGAGCIFEIKRVCTVRPMPMDWTRPE